MQIVYEEYNDEDSGDEDEETLADNLSRNQLLEAEVQVTKTTDQLLPNVDGENKSDKKNFDTWQFERPGSKEIT